MAQSSKRAVIERLLREEKIGGAQLLSFGDGPVEIRLTKEFGGLAVGVASDEEMNGSILETRGHRAVAARGKDRRRTVALVRRWAGGNPVDQRIWWAGGWRRQR